MSCRFYSDQLQNTLSDFSLHFRVVQVGFGQEVLKEVDELHFHPGVIYGDLSSGVFYSGDAVGMVYLYHGSME